MLKHYTFLLFTIILFGNNTLYSMHNNNMCNTVMLELPNLQKYNQMLQQDNQRLQTEYNNTLKNNNILLTKNNNLVRENKLLVNKNKVLVNKNKELNDQLQNQYILLQQYKILLSTLLQQQVNMYNVNININASSKDGAIEVKNSKTLNINNFFQNKNNTIDETTHVNKENDNKLIIEHDINDNNMNNNMNILSEKLTKKGISQDIRNKILTEVKGMHQKVYQLATEYNMDISDNNISVSMDEEAKK